MDKKVPTLSLLVWNEGIQGFEDGFDLDPLLEALVMRLPGRKQGWEKEQREAWIRLFHSIADELYPNTRATHVAIPEAIPETPRVTDAAPIPVFIKKPKPVIEKTITETATTSRVTTHRIDDDEEGDDDISYTNIRAEIVKVLRSTSDMLLAREIYDASDNFIDDQYVFNSLSHMTLRKGWLIREKRIGGFAYQINPEAQLPDYLLRDVAAQSP